MGVLITFADWEWLDAPDCLGKCVGVSSFIIDYVRNYQSYCVALAGAFGKGRFASVKCYCPRLWPN